MLKIKTVPFQTWFKTPESYFWLNGNYYNVDDLGYLDFNVKNERKLKRIYNLFNISLAKVPKEESGKLKSPKRWWVDLLMQQKDPKELCRDDM